MISDSGKDALRRAGLLFYDEGGFPIDHSAYPSGLPIYKPTQSLGNGSPDYEIVACPPHTEDEEFWIYLNAPSLVIFSKESKWFVVLCEGFAPGPGPVDFKQTFGSETEAIERVTSFYFDPTDRDFLEWKRSFDGRQRLNPL